MRMGNRELYIVPYMAIEEHGKKEHAYRIQTNCMHMNINSFFQNIRNKIKICNYGLRKFHEVKFGDTMCDRKLQWGRSCTTFDKASQSIR